MAVDIKTNDTKGECVLGSVKFDTDKASRAYSTRYDLETTEGVTRLLRDSDALHYARIDLADYAASDILIDLNSAAMHAGLTSRESGALMRIYSAGMTHKETAFALGIPLSELSALVESAIEKITEVYKRWEYGEVYGTVAGALDSDYKYEDFEEAA